MDWTKYLSREFLLAVVLIISATVIAFKIITTDNFDAVFIRWAAACGVFAAIYTGGKTIQKVKNGKIR